MDADQFSHATRSGCACISGGFDRADVTANDGRDQSGVDLLPADEHNVGSLQHRVGRFDHAHQTAGFDHAEGVADVAPERLQR